MNKTLRFIALGTVLCAIPFLKTNAQETKNQVKVNLLPLATGTFAVEYERALVGRLTAVGMFSYRPESKLPFASSWNSLIDDEDTKDMLGNVTQGATSFAVEARFYTGKKGAFSGFYLAPYVKQATYSLGLPLPVDFDPPTGSGIAPISEVNTKGNLSTVSAGLGMGVQFKIAKNISLDWRIIGPGYGTSKGTLNGKADRDLTAEEQDEIRDMIDDLGDIPLVKIEDRKVDEKGVEFKVKGPWAGIRTGLSIGYRF